MKQITKEVFYADEPIVILRRQDIEYLKARVEDAVYKRIRLCAHANEEDILQEMFIVASKKSYIRPHKHLGKAESLHVVEGRADAVFFDEAGKIMQVIALGDYSSGLRFYYRVNEPVFHALIIGSDPFIFCETTQGPFRRSDSIFAPWSPNGSNKEIMREYVKQLARSVADFHQLQKANAP